MENKWFDVKDKEGVWRIGYCLSVDERGIRNVRMDGFPPFMNTLYCSHSENIQPIRKCTFGLTTPADRKPIRQVITIGELERMLGQINLLLAHPNLQEISPNMITITLRTEFLIMVDQILTSPFQIIRDTQILQLQINKFFLNFLSLHLRVLQSIKNISPDHQLFLALYQLTLGTSLILGNHVHSEILYNHKYNINIKTNGFIDFFVQSKCLEVLRNFAKVVKKKSDLTYQQKRVVDSLLDLFLYLVELGKGGICDGDNLTKSALVLQEFINYLKKIAEDETVAEKLSKNLALLGRIQSIYSKLKPNKVCSLRGYITKKVEESKISKEEENVKPVAISKIQKPEEKPAMEKNSDPRIDELIEKIHKLEELVTKKERDDGMSLIERDDVKAFKKPNIPTENLGEEMFLASLEWALETGQLQTAKKLTKWRKSLLQVGRIVGWEAALAIGCKTYKKAQITPEDIIEVNYELLKREQ